MTHPFTGGRRFGRRALIAGLAALPVAACSPSRLLRPAEPPRLFNLTPAGEFTTGLPRVEWQLLVETPLAHAGIDTTRVALQQSGNQLTYFSNANWVDTAPEMVQQLLVESFENTNRIVSVGREATGLRADFILKSDLREFHAEYGGGEPGKDAPEAHVRLVTKLVRMPRRNIVAGDTFLARVRATGPDMVDIVRAFDEAMDAVMRRAVEWTIRQGASNAESTPLPNGGI
ncbi:MAG: hypothetical protein RLY86_2496 [Pseudomonadota bacterium]|jgi:cholesterol transport system auxiliary component